MDSIKQTETEQPVVHAGYEGVNLIGNILFWGNWVVLIIAIISQRETWFNVFIILLIPEIIFTWLARFWAPAIKFHLLPGEKMSHSLHGEVDCDAKKINADCFVRLTDRRLVISTISFGVLPAQIVKLFTCFARPKAVDVELIPADVTEIIANAGTFTTKGSVTIKTGDGADIKITPQFGSCQTFISLLKNWQGSGSTADEAEEEKSPLENAQNIKLFSPLYMTIGSVFFSGAFVSDGLCASAHRRTAAVFESGAQKRRKQGIPQNSP